jgi:hypothetical protein
MKITRVQYTVKEDYAETNKKNIEAVMQEVRNLNDPDFKYATFLAPDGLSFMHLAIAATPEANDRLTSLESFKYFISELKSKGLENPVKSEQMQLVASGYDIFSGQ